jgi:hypothetical protein
MSALIERSCDRRLREISVALSRPNLNIGLPTIRAGLIDLAESAIHALRAMCIQSPL